MNTRSVIHPLAVGSGSPILNRILPDLLDTACDRTPNDRALNQWSQGAWQSLSNTALRRAAEEFALGLDTLKLRRGDRVAFVMHSDIGFAIADMGCLLAGVISVPIDLTQTIENILFILQQVEASALVISNPDLLYQLMPYFGAVPDLRWVIVADREETRGLEETQGRGKTGARGGRGGEEDGEAIKAKSPPSPPLPITHYPPSPDLCLQIPHFLCNAQSEQPYQPGSFPQRLQVFSLAEVRGWGRQAWSADRVWDLRDAIAPQDLATILYIASDTKRPKGVMLTHENITANVLAAFSSYPDLQTGPEEEALLFLPLTHIFARVFLYGHLAWGHSVYLSDPNHLIKHMRRVKPTFLITVPRLLEKVHERILDRGRHLGRFDRGVFAWAVKLAARFELNRPLRGLYGWQMQLADRLVFAKWRAVFGGRLKACICGGAALSGELVRFFSAAGVPVSQGYGLTETSGVLSYTRGVHNQAGTVGVPISGVELAIASDHEILIRAPFVMQGYYRDLEATHQALDPDGWLHTGDLGALSSDGLLTITGVKKPLFKLSTGKYVSPLPLEEELMRSPLVAHAVTVGANHKFCGMLIFPNLAALHAGAEEWGLDNTQPDWLQHPRFKGLYQTLIDTANCHLPYWSTVRKFALVEATLTQENDLLLPDGSVNRRWVWERFAEEIEGLYGRQGSGIAGEQGGRGDGESGDEGWLPHEGFSCPIYAKSLMRH